MSQCPGAFIRVLLQPTREPWSLPCNAEDLSDNPAFRERAQSLIVGHSWALVSAVEELQQLGLVSSASAEIRTIRSVQLFKLYLINEADLFFGFYPILERALSIDGTEHQIFDLMGKDATLFHHQRSDDDDDTNSRFVAEAMAWFESVWSSIAIAAL